MPTIRQFLVMNLTVLAALVVGLSVLVMVDPGFKRTDLLMVCLWAPLSILFTWAVVGVWWLLVWTGAHVMSCVPLCRPSKEKQ